MRPDRTASSTGRHAAVSAGSAPAAEVAMDVLHAGGTAIDAAIAGSAAQCVVEMPWCGIGGDAFVLVRAADRSVTGFNGSGAAPAAVRDVTGGLTRVPRFGPVSVAVPAIVDTWASLHERFATLPFAELLEPARQLAAEGFTLDGRTAAALARAPGLEGAHQLAPLRRGVQPRAGQRFVQGDLAESLGVIAAEGRDGFYRGVLAKRIADHACERGGALGLADLAAHRGTWVLPPAVRYRGTLVHSNGLVSSGVLMLLALRVLERVRSPQTPTDEVGVTDVLVRIVRLLFDTVAPTLGDPRFGGVPDVLADGTVDRLVAELRQPGDARSRRGLAAPAASDTTSLAVAAPDGSTVCFIHSLFNEFGSRELVTDTGIVLNDRLANLVVDGDDASFDPSSPNALVPGKRPLHTLHGYVAEWPSGRVVAGATPGGRGQVQTNVQLLARLIDGHEELQPAVSAPRWVHGTPRSSNDDECLYLEPGLAHLEGGLAARGHDVVVVDGADSDRFGNCTVVSRDGDRLEAAADPRRGGKALTW
jgi:gamma-glutamyltranspeptidase/glutathione hydrolase